ncbi:MAG: hypothetical protein II936_05575, partial [Oscillospiraceae bacterium]|nr:hypothetical protein [Oscillospiraceae bacterium]
MLLLLMILPVTAAVLMTMLMQESKRIPFLQALAAFFLGSAVTFIRTGMYFIFVMISGMDDSAFTGYYTYRSLFGIILYGILPTVCRITALDFVIKNTLKRRRSYDTLICSVLSAMGYCLVKNIIDFIKGEPSGAGNTGILLSTVVIFCTGIIMGHFYNHAKSAENSGDKMQQIKYLFISFGIPAAIETVFGMASALMGDIGPFVEFVILLSLIFSVFLIIRWNDMNDEDIYDPMSEMDENALQLNTKEAAFYSALVKEYAEGKDVPKVNVLASDEKESMSVLEQNFMYIGMKNRKTPRAEQFLADLRAEYGVKATSEGSESSAAASVPEAPTNTGMQKEYMTSLRKTYTIDDQKGNSLSDNASNTTEAGPSGNAAPGSRERDMEFLAALRSGTVRGNKQSGAQFLASIQAEYGNKDAQKAVPEKNDNVHTPEQMYTYPKKEGSTADRGQSHPTDNTISDRRAHDMEILSALRSGKSGNKQSGAKFLASIQAEYGNKGIQKAV